MPGDCPTVVPGGSSVSAEGTLLYPSSEEAVFSEEGEMQTVEVEGTVEEDDKLEESAHCSCCICSNGPLPWEADPNWRPARIAETMDAVRQLAPQVDASEMSFELQGFPYCPNQWGQAGEAELPQTMPKGKFGALGTNLFAFGLPIGWGREKLIEHFRVCGTIVSCRVIKDPKLKKSRGYGFVCFLDHKSTLRALQRLNGLEVGSGSFRKRLRVTIKLGEEKFFLAAMRECDREEKEKVANLDGDAADANTRDSEEKGKRKKRRGARKKAAEKKKAALAEEEVREIFVQSRCMMQRKGREGRKAISSNLCPFLSLSLSLSLCVCVCVGLIDPLRLCPRSSLSATPTCLSSLVSSDSTSSRPNEVRGEDGLDPASDLVSFSSLLNPAFNFHPSCVVCHGV